MKKNNNTCACFREDKDTKNKHVFSFTNKKHLCWHKEQIRSEASILHRHVSAVHWSACCLVFPQLAQERCEIKRDICTHRLTLTLFARCFTLSSPAPLNKSSCFHGQTKQWMNKKMYLPPSNCSDECITTLPNYSEGQFLFSLMNP